MSVAVQTQSQYNNLMHRETTLITTNRLRQLLIQHRIKQILARIAEELGFVIPYDPMLGSLGLTISRLLLKMVNLSLNRRQIILFSKNSLKKTQTQEIRQLKQFITMVAEAKLVRRTSNYIRRWGYLRLCPTKVYTIIKNIL